MTDNHYVSETLQGNQHRVFLDGKFKTVQQGLTLVNRRESASFISVSFTHLSLIYLPHSYSPMSQGAGDSFMKLYKIIIGPMEHPRCFCCFVVAVLLIFKSSQTITFLQNDIILVVSYLHPFFFRFIFFSSASPQF